jgi:hypothetical protein
MYMLSVMLFKDLKDRALQLTELPFGFGRSGHRPLALHPEAQSQHLLSLLSQYRRECR